MSVKSSNTPLSHADIRRQIKLPFSKAFEISLKSIKIRFARSIITAAGIFLGIAFFTSVRMAAEFQTIQDGILTEKQAMVKAGIKLNEHDQMLVQSATDANSEAGRLEKKSGKDRLNWLSIMALIVCTVGITNAMLMSVTERYKEIGTMKCLGALDSFIVKLFFIESCLIGFISSLIGFMIGWVVLSLMHLISDGTEAFGLLYWAASFKLLIISVTVGTILTYLATIAPAIRAAQMPPAAALRVEI